MITIYPYDEAPPNLRLHDDDADWVAVLPINDDPPFLWEGSMFGLTVIEYLHQPAQGYKTLIGCHA